MRQSLFLTVMILGTTISPVATARPKSDADVIAPKTLLDTVGQAFSELDWIGVPVADDTALELHYTAAPYEWTFYAVERPEAQILLFYSAFSQVAPPEHRPQAQEFLHRANWGLRIGNFEMDVNDGRVRYKTSVDVSDGALTKGMVKDLIAANVLTAERYLPGLQQVMAGEATAEQAIASVEQGPTTPSP